MLERPMRLHAAALLLTVRVGSHTLAKGAWSLLSEGSEGVMVKLSERTR